MTADTDRGKAEPRKAGRDKAGRDEAGAAKAGPGKAGLAKAGVAKAVVAKAGAAKAGVDWTEAPRHLAGPRPIGAIMPAVTRPAYRAQHPAGAQLMADWALIVGPANAAAATPRRFRAGTLTLGCAGPAALELQHLADQVMARINGHFGEALVRRLRFVQEAPAPAPRSAMPARRVAEPVAVEGLADGPLRDALAALGGAVRAGSRAGGKGRA